MNQKNRHFREVKKKEELIEVIKMIMKNEWNHNKDKISKFMYLCRTKDKEK